MVTGRLAVCEMTALEVLYSARSAEDYARIASGLNAYRWLRTSGDAMQRALQVQAMLARKGRHRCPLPDLIIAATAELHGATVLHADRDFETVAAVTGQLVEHIGGGEGRG